MKKFVTLLLLAVSFTLVGAQQFSDLSKEVPFDAAFRKGVLPNGLTYYIRHNQEPKERASFYIYQNVGALLENDDQNGLAHFLEHMAFNGTTTFPGKTMLDMLERNGVKFGRDVNAYTAHNETVYNISRVPVNNAGLVDSCLLILRDWSNNLALTTEEIDAERGVISEEWRTRRNASFRIRGELAPVIYNGSKYAERDVIGDLNVIKTFKPETLKAFYHDWYRTDLQAIAIVGDIDVDAVEKQVIELFSAIPAVENPKPRTTITIPENKEPLFKEVKDKEQKNVSVSLMIRHPFVPKNTLEELRESYVNHFFNTLISQHYKEILSKADAPFLNASVSYGGSVRGYKSFNIQITAKQGEDKQAFEAAYTELQRVLDHGFTQSELDRLKTNTLAGVENRYKRRDKVGSESICKSIKSGFLNGISLTDEQFKYDFAKEIVPTITLDEVSAVAAKYMSDKNRVYTVIGPEKDGLELISLDEIQSIIAKVEASQPEAYIDNMPDNTELLSNEPKGGTITGEKKIDLFNATEWTLSNGVKVVYRFADYSKNSVTLNAISDGGSSLYGVNDIPSFIGAAQYVSSFGLGQFDPVQLKKVLTGKSASVNYQLSSFNENISGSSTTNDVETMLKLVYMKFEEPRFDKEKYNNLMDRNRYNIEHKVITPQSFISDTITTILTNGNPRALKFNKEYLDQMDYNRIREIYKERFANAADFTFFIVGDVNADTLKPLVEKYIGSLKTTDDLENWVKHKDYFPKGKNIYRINVAMQEPKATVVLKMKADAEYSRETVIYQSIISSILNLRYTENIREKEGGTYGVSVRSGFTIKPETKLSMDISFDCDPAKADHLKSLIYKELSLIQKQVSQADLDKVVLNMKKGAENRTEHNSFWSGALIKYYETGENKLDPAYYDAILENVTTKEIKKAAKQFLKKADVVDIIFLPEQKN